MKTDNKNLRVKKSAKIKLAKLASLPAKRGNKTKADKQTIYAKMDEAIAENIDDGIEIPQKLQDKFEQAIRNDFPKLADDFGISPRARVASKKRLAAKK